MGRGVLFISRELSEWTVKEKSDKQKQKQKKKRLCALRARAKE